jgi:uncharacterized protein (DUF362 family)
MGKMSKVAIIKGSDPTEITVKALEAVKPDLNAVLSSEKPILIKPNYITAQHPSTGITTDGRVVEGVVKFLKEHGKDNIIIGEGSGWADTFEAFKVAGIDKISEKWKVKLVDLNKDALVESIRPIHWLLKRLKWQKQPWKAF